MEELKELYNVKEVAALLNVLPASVNYYICKGKLKATKFNGAYVITKADLEEYLSNRKRGVKNDRKG